MKRSILFLLMLSLALPVFAANDMPGKDITVKPARATWNTGYFQEALVRAGLTELGYDVEQPKELQNPLFYQSVMLGDVDYWTNGWFPNHVSQMPKGSDERVEIVGYVVKAGGLQGYLVSKKHVEQYNIQSLDDFKRDDVKKAFDSNGDGKADLTACPPGWGCEKVITHHFEVYNLDDHINPIKAGFVVSDIQVVANKKFLKANPAAKRFFEVFTLPLSDINVQNTKMQDGEKSQEDIERHAKEWIAANQDTWNGWLEDARKAAK